MKRCKTCQFWKQFKDEVWGTCELAETEGAMPKVLPTLAMAQDLESCAAQLQTRQNFGCVQWEKKE